MSIIYERFYELHSSTVYVRSAVCMFLIGTCSSFLGRCGSITTLYTKGCLTVNTAGWHSYTNNPVIYYKRCLMGEIRFIFNHSDCWIHNAQPIRAWNQEATQCNSHLRHVCWMHIFLGCCMDRWLARVKTTKLGEDTASKEAHAWEIGVTRFCNATATLVTFSDFFVN